MRRLRWLLRPERVMVLVGLMAGSITVFVRPPFGGPDELNHLQRAYQISEGTFVAERAGNLVGGYMPPGLVPGETSSMSPVSGRVFRHFLNTSLFPPIAYIPHAVTIAAGRMLGAPNRSYLYLGRLAGLTSALFLAWLAIRITPIAKWLFVLLAVTPMSMQQMTTVSADTITNFAAFVWIAMMLRLNVDEESRLAGRLLAGVMACGLVVAIAKLVYLPILLLCLLCPVAKAGGGRRYAVIFGSLVATCLVAVALWLIAVKGLYEAPSYYGRPAAGGSPPVAEESPTQSAASYTDPPGQVIFIVTHPFRYAKVVLTTLARRGFYYLQTALGYAGNLPVPSLIALHVLVLLGVVLLDQSSGLMLSFRSKATVLAVFCVTVVFLMTVAYAGWNTVGQDSIRYVYGRYFVPVLPIPFLLFSTHRFSSVVPERFHVPLMTCLTVGYTLPTIPVWHIG